MHEAKLFKALPTQWPTNGANMQIIGILGSALFALCGFPQALACYRQGHARGLDPWFLWAWFLGEVSTAVYVYSTVDKPLILLSNYMVNGIFLMVIFRYKYFERV